MRAVALFVAAALLGCGSDKKDEPSAAVPCALDDVRIDGACVPTGVPPDRCGAGLHAEARGCAIDATTCATPAVGECLAPGIATCAPGFTRDGEGSCKPILPSTPCAAGTLALPGDTACAAVDTCSEPTGDLYVDASAAAGGDGTRDKPLRTLAEAIASATTGKSIAVLAGTYAENVVVDKSLTIVGACTEKVKLAPADTTKPLIRFASGTSTLRSVALTGGIDVAAANVTLRSLWLHDVGRSAISTTGASTTTASRVLVEAATEYAISVVGGTTNLDGVVVRATRPRDTGERGIGINVESAGIPAAFSGKQLVIDGNADCGILLHAADAVIERSVIVNTKPRASGVYGVGINALAYSSTSVDRGNSVIRDSYISGNTFAGVFVGGVPVTLERTTIRDTKLTPTGSLGRGIIVQDHPVALHRGELTMRSSVVEQNAEVGVLVASSTAVLEDSIVRATRLRKDGSSGVGVAGQLTKGRKEASEITLRRTLVDSNRTFGVYGEATKVTIDRSLVRGTRPGRDAGWGVHVLDDRTASVPAELTMTASIVEDNTAHGVFTHLARTTIERSVIRGTVAGAEDYTTAGLVTSDATLSVTGSILEDNEDTDALLLGCKATIDAVTFRKPRPRKGLHGIGLVAHSTVEDTPTELTISGSLVDGALTAGILVGASTVRAERVLIRDVLAEPLDGKFGDGILLRSVRGAPGALQLHSSAITNVARAGVAVFGSDATLAGNAIACAKFAIDIEPFEDRAPALSDAGGNNCGCNVAAACRALSSSLEPVSIDDRTSAR